MNLVSKCGRNLLLLVWIIFIVYALVFEFSYFLCLVLVLLHLFFKRAEREIINDDALLAPIDAKVEAINIDEEKKEISIVLKKSFLSFFLGSQELRAVQKANNIKYYSQNGLAYSEQYFCNASIVEFESGISLVLKPAAYSFLSLDKLTKARAGERIGFFSHGKIELRLPYEARILVGIGDSIVANSAIAKIGE